MPYHVYHLVDPNTREVKYVGKSTNPRSRYRQHLKESAQRQNTAKKQWIHQLAKQGQQPVMVIASTHPDDDSARRAESAQVHAHRASILNIHDPARGAADLHKQAAGE